MNLYLVECVHKTVTGFSEIYPVYVVASNPAKAEELALDLMITLHYKYDDFISSIKLIASINTHRAEHLLVME